MLSAKFSRLDPYSQITRKVLWMKMIRILKSDSVNLISKINCNLICHLICRSIMATPYALGKYIKEI